MTRIRRLATLSLTVVVWVFAGLAQAAELPDQLPDPADTPPDTARPVQVYILAGQSNMVGMGEISPGRPHHAGEVFSGDPAAGTDPIHAWPNPSFQLRPVRFFRSAEPDAARGATAYLYAGQVDPQADYDTLAVEREVEIELGATDGLLPALDGRHTCVVKAFLEIPSDGTFTLHAGYGDSSHCSVVLDGTVVYQKAPGTSAQTVPVELVGGRRYAFTVTYHQGGSTAFWMQRVGALPVYGDLTTLTRRDGMFPHLVDDAGDWTVRNDVYLQEARLGFSGSPLTVPPVPGGTTIGPELQFGHILGHHHEEQVLLIKTAQGNRSLGWDFRPPSSGRTNPEDQWESTEYRLMIEGVRKTLDQIADIVPGYDGQGYEIAGFVWFQGHKDGFDPVQITEYEQNLTHLIRDVRAEFEVPEMPVVVATVGFGGYAMRDNYQSIFEAQIAVADPEKHPEYEGNVRSVDIRPFWREVAQSPKSEGYHYNRNAETYMLIGDAMGRAMVDLLEGRDTPESAGPPAVPASDTATLDTPTEGQIAARQAAIEPIVVDGMVPAFVEANRETLRAAADGERPARVSQFLRDDLFRLNQLYRYVGIDDYDWQPFGPDMRNAQWEYHSFDPPEEQPRDEGGPRYREVTYPERMADWTASDFDAESAGWQNGLPPFGQLDGELAPLNTSCDNPLCGCGAAPRTLWDKEVLLIRGVFDFPPLKPGHRYRIVVGGSAHVNAGEGYAIYVNGRQLIEIPTGVPNRQGGQPRGAFIDAESAEAFMQGGEVTIAATSFLRYHHPRQGPIPPRGHFDVWVEEMLVPPLGDD